MGGIGSGRTSKPTDINEFRKRYGDDAADLMNRYGADPHVSCMDIASIIGCSRQNVRQLAKRLNKTGLKEKKRPWGGKFKPEIENILLYLQNRFGNVKRLRSLKGPSRRFLVNNYIVAIGIRNKTIPNTNSIPVSFRGEPVDYKIIIFRGMVLVIPGVRDYIATYEMRYYRDNYGQLL